jgi:hypothetical protein
MADEQDDKNNAAKAYILPNYEVLVSVTMKIPTFWDVTP